MRSEKWNFVFLCLLSLIFRHICLILVLSHGDTFVRVLFFRGCHLVTVPCLRRASSMEEEYDIIGEEILFDTNDEDIIGWIVTHRKPRGNKNQY